VGACRTSRCSGRQSFQRAQEQGRLPTTAEAAYSKLRHVPLSLSLGFFEEATQRLQQVLPAMSPATSCYSPSRETV
jgi:hypothetical protein